MLRIRLQRTGRKKSPFYHVVVAENLAPIKGRVTARLGYYNPLIKPWSFEVDLEKVSEWISKGARPTNTVARLLKAAGMENVDKFIIEMKDRKKKNAPDEPEEKPAPVAEKAAEEEASAPATEEVVEEIAPVVEEAAPNPTEEEASAPEVADEEAKEAVDTTEAN